MPNRDYAVRPKSKKSGNKLLILIIILLLLLLSGMGLWILSGMWQKPSATAPVTAQQEQKPKTALPSKPEEIYSYIRDLETREVPVDKNSKLAKLTKEQEQQILKQKEEEQRRLEQQAQAAQGVTQEVTATASENVPLTEEQLAQQKEQEQKAAEEKRKQAELKKQQELAKKAEQAKAEAAKAQQQPKIVATAKPASEAPKSVGKYGLQCGAFKNKAQAENMQARLAMAGYNARINSSAEWNRVVVGPIGDRSAASAAQSNARSVAECLIVGM